ncbi:hypothetical protein ACIRS1_29085 [Kitasatospora sp. NPDC101176]|uniref:hypothetical protein n=1 Tax=Kitasatospora sp. NPDC101176 TaxID=3364099 RepID=UPI00380756FC
MAVNTSLPPNWLQIATDVALIFGALLALGTVWVYRRSGPRIDVHAEVDSRNTLRITVINAGRLETKVFEVAVGTLRRRRFKHLYRRIPDVLLPDPAIEVCDGPIPPFTIKPGEAEVWLASWPNVTVEVKSESRRSDSRMLASRQVVSPTDRRIRAIASLNDRAIGTRIRKWPTTAGNFPLPSRRIHENGNNNPESASPFASKVHQLYRRLRGAGH